MRRKVAIAISLALLMPSTMSSMAATPKAGAKCSKLGSTSTAAGKMFTCIKTGSKTVWNKGLAIKKPAPTRPRVNSDPIGTVGGAPTPAPTPAPTDGDPPLRPEGCGTGTFYYRVQDGSMERSFYEDKSYSKYDARLEASFNPIRAKAFNLVRENFITNPEIKAKIQSHVSPGFPKELLGVLQQQLLENVAFWQEYFPAGSTVQATYFTGDDPDFANNSKQTMNGPLEIYFLEELKKPKIYNCSLGAGVSGGHLVNQGPNRGQSGYWFAANSPPQKTYWAPGYQPHELTHSVQALIVQELFTVSLPVNFMEGGAEFFGLAMGFSNLGWYSDEVDRRLTEKDSNEFIMEINSTDDVIKMLELTEANPGPFAGGTQVTNSVRWAYSMGNLLWEWVTAEYGYEAYWSILKSINLTRSYEQSIQKTLGLSKSQMYKNASPYILSQIQLALGKNWKDAWKSNR